MITPPAFKKDALPTTRGWTHPLTGELLVSRPISQNEIDEFLGVTSSIDIDEPELLLEDDELLSEWQEEIDVPPVADLHAMTKRELETLGRSYGVELDRRQSKNDLIEQLQAVIDEANEEPIEDDAF